MNKKAFILESPYLPSGDQPQAIEKLVELRPSNTVLMGVTGSGKTFTIANVIAKQTQSVIILSPNKTLAAQLYEEFYRFFPHNKVCYFVSYYDYYQPESYLPATDVYIEKETKINQEIDRMRIESVSAAVNRKDTIIVSSVSCIYSLGNPKDFKELSLPLVKNQNITQKKVIEELLKIEYKRNDHDIKMHGTFSVRGNSIEVVLSYQKEALRIECTDEKISYLSWIHQETRLEIQSLEDTIIMPAKYFVTTEEKKNKAIKSIKQELDSYLPTLTNSLYQERLYTRVMRDIEFIKETGTCPGIENYSAHFDSRLDGKEPYTLFDFLDNPLIIIDESHLAIPQLRGMYIGDQARKKNLIEYGFRLPSSRFNRPLSFPEVEKKLHNVIYVSATPGEYELANAVSLVEQVIRPTGIIDPEIEIHPRKNQLEYLESEIRAQIKKNARILVTVMTKKMAEDLSLYFEKKEIKACYLHHSIKTQQRTELLHKLRNGVFDCMIGINLLREGLDLPEVGLVAIMDADIESFLRDKRSLIQTIGRAARNNDSKVILFADKISSPMEEAIQETNRRRTIQQEYNQTHDITPKKTNRSIKKSILSLSPEKKIQKSTMKKENKELERFKKLPMKKKILFLTKLKKEIIALFKQGDLDNAKNQKKILEEYEKLTNKKE
jgi:excinuclease ABC subunit B